MNWTFDDTERKELERSVEAVTDGSDWITLDRLLTMWADFVNAVEDGYEESIYEYLNDLSSREVLEDVMLRTRTEAREKLKSVLRAYDDRFHAATTPAARPLVDNKERRADWWHRVPTRLHGSLKRDLVEWGVVS